MSILTGSHSRWMAALALMGANALNVAQAEEYSRRPSGGSYQNCPPKHYSAPRAAPRLGPDGKPAPADSSPSDEAPRPDDATRPGDAAAQQQIEQARTSPAPSTLASGPQSAAPNMTGDFVFSRTQIIATDTTISPSTVTADVPLASSRRFKISEFENVLPQDRVFFTYNYFENAFTVDTQNFVVDPQLRDFDYNAYMVGFEKTFFSRLASVAVRLPINSSVDFGSTNFDLNNDGGIGNATVTLKGVLASTCDCAIGAGLAIMTPTGDDTFGSVNDISFTIQNDTVHLMPYVGFVYAPRGGSAFLQSALQLDFDVNGNDVTTVDSSSSTQTGNMQEQTLLYWDVAVGYWLHRNCCNNTGLAAILELHYSTSVDDAEAAVISDGTTTISFGNPNSNIDIWNLTVASHIQLGRRDVRLGVALPLNDEHDRVFDYELVAQFNQRF